MSPDTSPRLAAEICGQGSGALGAMRRVHRAVDRLAEGKLVIVVGPIAGRPEGALVGAATHAMPDMISFLVRHSSGFVQVAMTTERASALQLPPMTVSWNHDQPNFAVAVDAAAGVSTGISAHDRARTIRLLGDATAKPADFRRPGHVVPIGVPMQASRSSTTISLEYAGIRLAAAAGCTPVALLASVVSPLQPTRMANMAELTSFANDHGMELLTTADLVQALASLPPLWESAPNSSQAEHPGRGSAYLDAAAVCDTPTVA